MRIISALLLLTVLAATTSCSRIGVSIANFPALFSKQKITRDIDFGSKNGSKLDVYTPAEIKTKLPVIVFFYGGKWSYGSKNDYRFVADAFTKLGYIVVIPDYIKYPKVKFPEWQRDAAKAVTWVHNNISQYGGDNNNLFLAGHSAGAHIGALLTTDNEYLAAEGGNKNWVKAFAGLAGPYDFIPKEDDLKDMFGPPERYKYMQVTNYVDGEQAPMLLLWGKQDKDVGEINIKNLVAGLKQKGGKYEVRFYDDVDHIDIIAALSRPARNRAPVIDDINSFFRRNHE